MVAKGSRRRRRGRRRRRSKRRRNRRGQQEGRKEGKQDLLQGIFLAYAGGILRVTPRHYLSDYLRGGNI